MDLMKKLWWITLSVILLGPAATWYLHVEVKNPYPWTVWKNALAVGFLVSVHFIMVLFVYLVRSWSRC